MAPKMAAFNEVFTTVITVCVVPLVISESVLCDLMDEATNRAPFEIKDKAMKLAPVDIKPEKTEGPPIAEAPVGMSDRLQPRVVL